MFTAVLLLTLTAAPPELRKATQALDDFRYDEALKLLPQEGAIQNYERAELTEWFSTSALALLNLKRENEATRRFLQLFSFAPEWVLPDQYGPRVQTLVAKTRADAARNGVVSVRFEGGLLRTTSDSLGLASALAVSWRVKDGVVERALLELKPAQQPPWPRGTAVEAWARVVGLSGSTLATWGSENEPVHLEPMTVQVSGREAPVATSGTGLRAPGFIGLGALGGAAVSAVLGIGFALGSQDAQRALGGVTRDMDGRITSLTQRDAFALDARARSDATAAGVLFTVAGVLAAGGVGLLLFDRLTVVPTPGGVAMVLRTESP
ncbi:MAG: hypothetical protein QM817_30055 [Archangium sp.]